ncbi:hypothetical protein HAX54_016344 [Datura stramonium]|uniref:Uncharacterized protein n=1 Tax=Datura stramonium TaxID=4076 RepID=A0ABS8UIN9_DATST|nr:hypothetical protein [Datura stramonium]
MAQLMLKHLLQLVNLKPVKNIKMEISFKTDEAGLKWWRQCEKWRLHHKGDMRLDQQQEASKKSIGRGTICSMIGVGRDGSGRYSSRRNGSNRVIWRHNSTRVRQPCTGEAACEG